MNKKYTIEQFPKFKKFEDDILSKDQILLRHNSKERKIKGETKKCKTCNRILHIIEFWFCGAARVYRYNDCRDCKLKDKGVIEIGKTRVSNILSDKNVRRCGRCKDIKPFHEFYNDKRYGKECTCKICSKEKNDIYVKKNKEEISDVYIKRYYYKKYKKEEFTDELLEKLRLDILEKRRFKFFIDDKKFKTKKPFTQYIEKKYGISASVVYRRLKQGWESKDCKISIEKEKEDLRKIQERNKKLKSSKNPILFLDGKSFTSKLKFAEYVYEKYDIKVATVRARLQKGYTEEECLYSENEVRRMKRSKGKIKVTDIITGEIMFFVNSNDPKLLENFRDYTIRKALKDGIQTTTEEKYSNPCIIERIPY